jgi:hypothetical protein
LRAYLVFLVLFGLKLVSRLFYRHDMRWINQVPRNPWAHVRVVALLNHTSLYEPLFIGGCPNSFLWRVARHGVLPAADKTMNRPIVGMLFRFIAHHVITISRMRDHTWFELLNRIDPNSMVIILPEGRMKRANGLDSHGQPMTVRGGIADVLESVGEGRMLIAYSGGLHHVQVPGQFLPRLFRPIAMRLELVEIDDYVERFWDSDPEQYKRNVRADLERRRELYCPVQEP